MIECHCRRYDRNFNSYSEANEACAKCKKDSYCQGIYPGPCGYRD